MKERGGKVWKMPVFRFCPVVVLLHIWCMGHNWLQAFCNPSLDGDGHDSCSKSEAQSVSRVFPQFTKVPEHCTEQERVEIGYIHLVHFVRFAQDVACW